jgi:hypothetical protein
MWVRGLPIEEMRAIEDSLSGAGVKTDTHRKRIQRLKDEENGLGGRCLTGAGAAVCP